eukprot:NODE_1241_length_1591_cov_6.067623_g1171_i0.p1 GENE.NODE_1241_length_1591_cov_6.067623_g1171_i0~~NODE_1241_length_1591_cov_6.067623_g1171_i0.p1  ORF type:complete len:305 (-),score=96.77 NODE_1241_length_1591_cov_6.067623_g1171_i0:66-980(-)
MADVYELLAFAVQVVRSHQKFTEGGVFKTDMLSVAIWAAGSICKLPNCDHAKLQGLFLQLFGHRNLSFHVEHVMRDLLQKYQTKYAHVFAHYVMPALVHLLCDGKSYRDELLCQCLDSIVHSMVGMVKNDPSIEAQFVEQLKKFMTELPFDALQAQSQEIVLDLLCTVVAGDHQIAMKSEAVQCFKRIRGEVAGNDDATNVAHRRLSRLALLLNSYRTRASRMKRDARPVTTNKRPPLPAPKDRLPKDSPPDTHTTPLDTLHTMDMSGDEAAAPTAPPKKKLKRTAATTKPAVAPKKKRKRIAA